MRYRWQIAWHIAWTSAAAYGGCHTDSGPESSSSTRPAECDSFEDCAGVAGAAACDSTGYCVDADGHRIGAPNLDDSRPSVSSVPCEERKLETCANDGACYVRQARPIDVERSCLLAPKPATCAPTDEACPDAPVQCAVEASGTPWFSVECGGLQRAPADHPCNDVVGSYGGVGGVDGGSAEIVDCPESVDAVAATCEQTAATAHALIDDAIDTARYDCSSDEDCVGSRQRLDCFQFCTVKRDRDDPYGDKVQEARRVCSGFEALGCEPEPPTCEPLYAVCRDGICVAGEG